MKIWYSIYNRKPFRGEEPSFYNKHDFNWTEILESNWLKIKDELEAHLVSNPNFYKGKRKQTINYHGSWKTMPLKTWGVEFHRNIENFPNTSEVLNQIPGLVSASFNLLEKGTDINSHFGETNASLRVHLGLMIPNDSNDVAIKVNNNTRAWKDGEILIFCDGYEHKAWNHSDQDRYILLLDIIRSEFESDNKVICANVLATLSLQSIRSTNKALFYISFIPLTILHFIAKNSALLLTPIHNMISKRKAIG